MIEIRYVHKSYGDLPILKGVNLTVEKGEIVSIIGASGAGKSTLLHILGTLDRPDRGDIMIGGKNVTLLNARGLSSFRNQNIGFVFQFHHLLPEFTALENICIPAFIAGIPRKIAEKRAVDLLELLKLSPRKDHKPQELSGGEQQRVAIARSLINTPDLILADEPSGNLDSVNADALHQLFLDLRRELHQTFIIVTHNPHLADLSDRILEMKDGIIATQHPLNL
jgi:lipoprotein-releasing system ATP-binding protein